MYRINKLDLLMSNVLRIGIHFPINTMGAVYLIVFTFNDLFY